ncbi:hypothetical protein ACN27F_26750 [Solwaraspora sp. WMMB335]|uniref:hypothetical protein n=1 Tax=Solwaraspora sp. WMMB335 TaxID=3404118 RepID=UPI003B92A5D0
MLVDIDSDYWDLPVLREAIAARVWGAASEGNLYRLEPLIRDLETTEADAGTPVTAVPAPRTGVGRHRRPTPVG